MVDVARSAGAVRPGRRAGPAAPRLAFAGRRAVWLSSALACAAVVLVPLWVHVDLVDPGIEGIIAVFAEVGVYPSDVCLALLALLAIASPVRLTVSERWLAAGATLLAVAGLLSARVAIDARLTGGLAAHLALLTLAWLGVRSGRVGSSALAIGLVASAVLQAALAAAQFALQQPLVPLALHLPWLPADPSAGGAPVVLSPAGDRLLRGFGTFPHPNVLGGYLALALVCLPLLGERWPRYWRLWWSLGAILSVGVVVSFSRAAWLAVVAGLAVWWWGNVPPPRTRRWLSVLVGGALLAIAVSPLAPTVESRLFPFGPTSNPLERGSIENRLSLDQQALESIARHFPFGVGGANYGLAALADGLQEGGWGEPAPNLSLLIAAELGLPGMLALLLGVVGVVGVVRAGGRSVAPAAAACAALLVLSMLDHYLWTMPLGRVIAWTPLALLAASRPPSAADQ